jgi:glycosyltransferase involved in cell wall biosynthesis
MKVKGMGNVPRVPVVSIGLPVFNGENFIADAINCTLSQTFSDWELIISDNNSTDDTVSICRKFAEKDSRIRIYQNERNLGVCLNYNRVFELSRGRYFKWITHDDLFGPEFLDTCIKELDADERVVLAFPKLVYVDSAGRPLRRQTSELSIVGDTAKSRVQQLMKLEIGSTDVFWCQFGLIRREVLEKTALMGLYSGSDQVLLLEIALQGKFRQVDKQLFFRREHPLAATLRSDWTMGELVRFVYADDKRRFVFPYFRMMKEHWTCIARTPQSFLDKFECTRAVLKRFSTQWKYFAEELLNFPQQALRAR